MPFRRAHLRLVVAIALSLVFPLTASAAGDDMIVKPAALSFGETVERLKAAIESRGAKIVAVVDHAAAAKANGLELDPATVVMFGNPKLGTPLMQSQPTAGLDLPLCVLVWQDPGGAVRVGYWPPSRIAGAHGIGDRDEVVAKMAAALDAISAEAAGP